MFPKKWLLFSLSLPSKYIYITRHNLTYRSHSLMELFFLFSFLHAHVFSKWFVFGCLSLTMKKYWYILSQQSYIYLKLSSLDYSFFFFSQIDPELAATQLQRVYRGYLSRREAERDREAELVFIGMRPAENTRIKEVCSRDGSDCE